MTAAARTLQERIRDTLIRLERDVDMWVATADESSGTPYLAPFSFVWDGEAVLMSCPANSRTSRNLLATGKVRVGIGPTRDLILIEGIAEAVEVAGLPTEVGNAFAVKTGFDPRKLTGPYLYFRIRPVRLQAWREENELKGRDLIVDGEWLQ